MKRESGVLMHISSLYGDYSVGSFGKNAESFIDFLHNCGFSWWQVLPLCPIDECNSPYQSHSAFAGNPYFVDLDILHDEKLITDSELEESRQKTPYSTEYARLYENRIKLLKKASRRAENRAEIENFANSDKYIKKFCEFMALKAANNGAKWQDWSISEPDSETLFMWKFIQFHFFRQWERIHEYANSRGVKILGDIPIYVAPDSSDVWGFKEQFLLDEHGFPLSVAGVPPDYFAPEGQHWGNPLYNWEAMEKDGFSWWCDRLTHQLNMFDGVRLDHFRGFESFWSIPAKSVSAKDGSWQKGPGMKLTAKLKKCGGDKLIVAEDLGDITPEVINLRDESGFPGMRVMQFGFLEYGDNIHKPHNYTNDCVAYTGTHDNNTLLGYLWELPMDMKTRMLRYCGYCSDNWEQGFDSLVRTLFASSAGLVMLPIQDLLKYGSDTRLNIPGKADGNWQYRITEEQLMSIDKSYYKSLNDLYSR